MKTLIIIRPHAVVRGLVGEILGRFERHGIRIVGLKAHHMSLSKAQELYNMHEGKPYYEPLLKEMVKGPSVFAVLDTDVLDQESAIALVRKIIGGTDPAQAEMGTIRGDYGLRIDKNIIHASDSSEAAEREIPIFFEKSEIVSFEDNR